MKDTTPAHGRGPLKSAGETAESPPCTDTLIPCSVFPASSSSSQSFRSSLASSSSLPSSSSSARLCCPCSPPGAHPSFSTTWSASAFPSSLPSFLPDSLSSSRSSVSDSSSTAQAACSPALCADAARRDEAAAAPPATAAPVEEWEEHPLFMTSMPTGDAFQRNPLLAALAAVLDEDEQLPFEAQRRRARGRDGRRRSRGGEEQRREEATKSRLFSPSSSGEEVGRTSALLPGTALPVGEEKRTCKNRTKETAAATAAYRSYRSTCMPYAPRQRTTDGKCKDEVTREKATGYTLYTETAAPEADSEPRQRDAPPSMGELHICMKMWQV